MTDCAWSIAKADSSVTSEPLARKLIENDMAQDLVIAGTASGGVMVYALEETGAYSENIPAAVSAGTYTVFFKVQGDANHNDTAPASVQSLIREVEKSADTDSITLTETEAEEGLDIGTLIYVAKKDGASVEVSVGESVSVTIDSTTVQSMSAGAHVFTLRNLDPSAPPSYIVDAGITDAKVLVEASVDDVPEGTELTYTVDLGKVVPEDKVVRVYGVTNTEGKFEVTSEVQNSMVVWRGSTGPTYAVTYDDEASSDTPLYVAAALAVITIVCTCVALCIRPRF